MNLPKVRKGLVLSDRGGKADWVDDRIWQLQRLNFALPITSSLENDTVMILLPSFHNQQCQQLRGQGRACVRFDS